MTSDKTMVEKIKGSVMRMRRFDRTDELGDVFSWRYIRQNAETAVWVFLSPLSGLWWASGKVYPLFDPFYGGRRYVFGKSKRDLRDRMQRAFANIRAKQSPEP